MIFINPLLVIVKTLSKLGGIFTNKTIQLLIVVTCTCIGLAIVSETITKCFPFLIGKFKTNKRIIEEETKKEQNKKLEEKIYEEV